MVRRIVMMWLMGILPLVNGYAGNIPSSSAIIFVSFSMPDMSIKGWMREAERIHAPVVIRGLVNNSFKDTISRMNELTKDNHGGVQLDPTLFQKFGVKKVPALVVRQKESFDIVYGDAHLDFALESIVKQKDELSPIAQNMLTMLREKQYG